MKTFYQSIQPLEPRGETKRQRQAQAHNDNHKLLVSYYQSIGTGSACHGKVEGFFNLNTM